MGMFGFISRSLNKTVEALKVVVPKKKLYFSKDELEDILLEADIEYDLVEIIIEQTYQEKITREILRSKLLATLAHTSYKEPEFTAPFVELIIGVNGAGKTTTISKLAKRYKDDGKKVILGAGDTFRAAAIEQLTLWANRLDIPIVSSKQGHDSSAVAYDTIDSAKSKGYDHVIIDTAGRLHTQTNLANELKKINRICGKCHDGAPHRTLLILDGTQGNSAIAQAKAFNDMVGVDGIIITKLDGTAKGGSVFSIAYALELPILYVGTGEQPEDLVPFDKYEFVDGILDALYIEEIDEEEKEVQSEEIQEEVTPEVEENPATPETEIEIPQEEPSKEEIIQEIEEEKVEVIEELPQDETVQDEISKEDVETTEKVVEDELIKNEIQEEEIVEEDNQKEELLQVFLKEERLIFLKNISETKVLVNYANTPVDTNIEFKDGVWSYI
jgi:fused signal recognition particle receptor